VIEDLPVKKNIHPNWVTATVTCACGNTFQTGATKESMRVEVCSNCHPFYTGQQRIVDTAGQVERFMRRASRAQNQSVRQTAGVQDVKG
jgi:large subunit ribosomal protein L31